jgi:hypothetical protein
MLNSTILHTLDQLYDNKSSLNIQQLEGLVRETLSFFELLRFRIESPESTFALKEEALDLGSQVQHKLEDLANKSLEESGLTKEQLDQILSNPRNFEPSDWEIYIKADEEIANYQKSLEKTPPKATARFRKFKTSKRLKK